MPGRPAVFAVILLGGLLSFAAACKSDAPEIPEADEAELQSTLQQQSPAPEDDVSEPTTGRERNTPTPRLRTSSTEQDESAGSTVAGQGGQAQTLEQGVPEADRDRVWPVPHAEGTTTAGVYYHASGGNTHVWIDNDGKPDAELYIACWDGRRDVIIRGLNRSIGNMDRRVAWSLQGEYQHPIDWYAYEDALLLALRPREQRARDQLWDALAAAERSGFRIEHVDGSTLVLKWQTSVLFNTPVQPNFDHCPPVFEPLTIDYGFTPQGIAYEASPEESYIVASSASRHLGAENATFVVHCLGGELYVALSHLPSRFQGVREANVLRWMSDGFDRQLLEWEGYPGTLPGALVLAELIGNGSDLMDWLRGAERVRFDFRDAPPRFAVEFNIRGMFATPVQPNLDHCGQY